MSKDIMHSGTLRPCPANPRYFADNSGKPIYLTGSHTWATLQERRFGETPELDYPGWLDFMNGNNHNFLRMWTWEHAAWMQFSSRKIVYYPNWYERTGPGEALDGRPKFDLTKPNEELFRRMRERVIAAGERGIYVSLMFFQGFSLDKTGGGDAHVAFKGHPYHPANNINGIDGDMENGGGTRTHTLDIPEITRLQETLVKKCIDTLGDLDHVLWEIANEAHRGSREWQYHMIDFIHEYEKGKPKQHPVGITGSPLNLPDMMPSNAERVSPGGGDGYTWDAPSWDGVKVSIVDTDHTNPWDAYRDPMLPWKCLLRGHNFVLMDPYMDARFGSPRIPFPEFDGIRTQMGYTRQVAEMLDLATMPPNDHLSSTGYCLANPSTSYLAVHPKGGEITVDLTAVEGTINAEWFCCRRGEFVSAGAVEGGTQKTLNPPVTGPAALLLRK